MLCQPLFLRRFKMYLNFNYFNLFYIQFIISVIITIPCCIDEVKIFVFFCFSSHEQYCKAYSLTSIHVNWSLTFNLEAKHKKLGISLQYLQQRLTHHGQTNFKPRTDKSIAILGFTDSKLPKTSSHTFIIMKKQKKLCSIKEKQVSNWCFL